VIIALFVVLCGELFYGRNVCVFSSVVVFLLGFVCLFLVCGLGILNCGKRIYLQCRSSNPPQHNSYMSEYIHNLIFLPVFPPVSPTI
jgi:hypothetical protein